jgi:hypothetical protein
MEHILNFILESKPIGAAMMSIRNNKELLHWLSTITIEYNPKNMSEMVYIVKNGRPLKCKCGNKREFYTYTSGYHDYCKLGSKCKSSARYKLSEEYYLSIGNNKHICACGNSCVFTSVDVGYRRTCKLGVNCKSYSRESKENRQRACLEKYGEIHHMKVKAQQEKVKATNLKKYGAEFPLQATTINKKFRNTLAQRSEEEIIAITNNRRSSLLKLHGVSASMQIHIGKEVMDCLNDYAMFSKIITGLTRAEACEKLGIGDTYLRYFNKKHQVHHLYKQPDKSKEEEELCRFLDSLQVEYISNSRNIIAPKELDIFIPKFNLAIEYDGLYWHSELSSGRDSKYHSLKRIECIKRGITLLTIFSDEWIYKKDIVISKIKNALGMSTKIYARKCQIRVVGKKEQTEFLNANHLQGSVGSTIALGLYYEDQIVSFMSFGKARFKNEESIELLRFCNKLSYIIVGGASKLFKYYVKHFNPKNIISYCDLRWSNGKLYEDLKFVNVATTIGYTYTDYKNRFNRMKFQKHKISNLIENKNLTGWEMMQELGYDRIWDCGQSSWVYSPSIVDNGTKLKD